MKIFYYLLITIAAILVNGCGGGGGGGSNTSSDTTPPTFTSSDAVSVPENQLSVITVHADDQSTVSYSITGGADSTKFALNTNTGVLTFKNIPDFENPSDSDLNNTYIVTVTATDTSNNQSQQTITATVTDVIEGLDSDYDYIPDEIENLIGTDPTNSDQNSNGILDGLDTEGTFGDPFFDMQWHIRSLGTLTNESGVETIAGNDLNLLGVYGAYMGYNHGNPIIVQVVDTGVDAVHEDLTNNMDLSRSYDGESVGDPTANIINSTYTHGTMVAGIMAAQAFNGKGVRGIVPFAKIAGSNWLETQTILGLEKVWYSGVGANEIAVTNNSWGSYFNSDTAYEDIMQLGTTNLRDGKGRIYVFSAGNDGYAYGNGNANLQYTLSNRYAIAVAALKNTNTRADYSTPGSNILVSGYSGNFYQDSPTIGTTTVMGTSSNTGDTDYTDGDSSNDKTTWDNDTNGNYTFIMNGTSSASPTVASAIALMLEACPNLTWRDVRYLLAKNAIQIDLSRSTWVENNAGYWHSIDYGFGLVNTVGMINECTSTYINLPIETTVSNTSSPNTPIPDNNTSISTILTVTNDITIEWVEVTVDNNSTWASDYKVELTSPSGTKTTLMTEQTNVSTNWMDGGFRLSTAAMLDESSVGTWTITFTDTWAGDSGTLKNIELKVYGH